MILKDLLKCIHFMEDVKIYACNQEEAVYTGSVLDVPWYLAEVKIYSEDGGISIEEDIVARKKYISIDIEEI